MKNKMMTLVHILFPSAFLFLREQAMAESLKQRQPHFITCVMDYVNGQEGIKKPTDNTQ